MELYKDILGYEGYYQISNHGNVKSLVRRHGLKVGGFTEKLREKVLISSPNSRGYKVVQLMMGKKGFKTVTVHSLVANHFLIKPESEEYITINHKDGNKLNNQVENLEWVTHSENVLHAFRTGLATGKKKRRVINQKNDH